MNLPYFILILVLFSGFLSLESCWNHLFFSGWPNYISDQISATSCVDSRTGWFKLEMIACSWILWVVIFTSKRSEPVPAGTTCHEALHIFANLCTFRNLSVILERDFVDICNVNTLCCYGLYGWKSNCGLLTVPWRSYFFKLTPQIRLTELLLSKTNVLNLTKNVSMDTPKSLL